MSNSVAEPVILVISRDEDFAGPLAEQVRRQLAIPCAVAANAEGVKPSVALVVTNEAMEDAPCPVLRVKNPPFKMRELLGDIMAARQKQSGEEMTLGHGYSLQPRQKELTHAGKSVALTDKEVKLLLCLAEASGKAVSKEQLLKDVWGVEAALDTHTLETHIYRLRAKFRELGDDEMVMAAEGGYRLKVDG